jgi:methylmalonyl-CoA/ethylmalonyl-CoA epimerase
MARRIDMVLNRLDHIAFRVHDIDSVVEFHTKTLGYTMVQEMTLDFGGTRAMSRVLNLPGTSFYTFVDQGLDPDNVVSKWVAKYGSGLHHMAYLVDDIGTAAETLRDRGMAFTTDHVIDTGGGLKQLFSLPHPVTRVITEIIQREKDDVFFVQENVIELIRSTEGL